VQLQSLEASLVDKGTEESTSLCLLVVAEGEGRLLREKGTTLETRDHELAMRSVKVGLRR
jgi:hypothetical protein